jgi:DNA-binding Xre family transcriptional regulator
LETGKTDRVDLVVLDRIAKTLGVAAAELVEREKKVRR